jgi:hypothetical protein
LQLNLLLRTLRRAKTPLMTTRRTVVKAAVILRRAKTALITTRRTVVKAAVMTRTSRNRLSEKEAQ